MNLPNLHGQVIQKNNHSIFVNDQLSHVACNIIMSNHPYGTYHIVNWHQIQFAIIPDSIHHLTLRLNLFINVQAGIFYLPLIPVYSFISLNRKKSGYAKAFMSDNLMMFMKKHYEDQFFLEPRKW